MGKLLVLAVLAAIASIAICFVRPFIFPEPPQPPQLDPNEWWGPMDLKGKVNASIKPFKVKFTDDVGITYLFLYKFHNTITKEIKLNAILYSPIKEMRK